MTNETEQLSEIITYADFTKVDIRVGTILDAQINEKARAPAYILTIDFGSLGIKTSSAQITANYSAEELKGKQIIAVTNFSPKRVAGVKSEVLVLACVCPERGSVLLEPDRIVSNDARVL